MKNFLSHLTFNNQLAIVAFAFGFVALFAGNPYQGSSTTLDAKELGLLVEKEADLVSVEELADWIIQGRSDYRLLDLRSEKDFSEYRIPSAENIPVSKLGDSELMRNEKIVLYSEGGIRPAQAWMLLKARAYKAAYILRGGLEEWRSTILFPQLRPNPTGDQLAAAEKANAVSKFFGGTPQTGTQAGGSSTPKLVMPKLEMPAATGGTGASPKKKKKEGC